MRKLHFENSRGEVITFDSTHLFIDSLTGIGEVDADIQGQTSPYQDGDTYIDTILQPRYPTLEGTILEGDFDKQRLQRKNILRVCNPKLGMGKLTLEIDQEVKEIDAVLDGSPIFPEQGEEVYQSFLINWKCPNPYWKDPNQTSKPLQAYVGNFTLPFTLPFELGKSGSRTILYNEGDLPAAVRIDVQGPVTNPRIINQTTGEWIRINRAIAADEILHIDTTEGSKRVEIYRGDMVYPALGYMDHDSTWLKLEVGENEIEHIADAGDRNSLVAFTWNTLYVGI